MIDHSKFNEKMAPPPQEMVDGAEAFSSGAERSENPHLPDTDSYEDWDYGWGEAESYEEETSFKEEKCIRKLM